MISFKDSNHVHLNTSKNFPFVTLLHLPACSNSFLSIFWAAHILILTVLIEMIAYVFRHSVFTGRPQVVCLLHTELLHQQIKFFLMLTTSIVCTTIESLVVGRISLVIFVDLIVVIDETPLVCHIGMCDIFFCNAFDCLHFDSHRSRCIRLCNTNKPASVFDLHTLFHVHFQPPTG